MNVTGTGGCVELTMKKDTGTLIESVVRECYDETMINKDNCPTNEMRIIRKETGGRSESDKKMCRMENQVSDAEESRAPSPVGCENDNLRGSRRSTIIDEVADGLPVVSPTSTGTSDSPK